MSKTDHYVVTNPADLIMNQLGIKIDNNSSTFDPKNQPISIDGQFNKKVTNKSNKYADIEHQQPEYQQNLNIDDEIPNNLLQVSTVNKSKQGRQKLKGRKKQSKRNVRKGNKNKQLQQNKDKDKEIQIDIGVGQVAEWGEKGTKAEEENQEQDFDEQPENNNKYSSGEQQAARKRIQQKLKKYQNSGVKQQKSTTSSLKNKALQLKNKNQSSSSSDKLQTSFHLNQTSQQLVNNKKDKKNQIVKQQQQQQSEDPWQKVNQKTIAEKQQDKQVLKNIQNIDFNKYYQNLALGPDDELDQQPEPQTGFFQSLCSCLKIKKKSITDLQKQIIKISKIQLTNKPEQNQLLKQIWIKITNKKYLRYGEHWNQIGFQGRDPATDLRSTGILSLLFWNNFLNFDTQYAIKISNFCTEFDIPLALTHIKITSIICSSIKNRLLVGTKWQDFLQWYYALTYYTFEYLLQNGKNLEQIGQLVEKSVQRTKNNLQNAKKYFNTQIKSKR